LPTPHDDNDKRDLLYGKIRSCIYHCLHNLVQVRREQDIKLEQDIKSEQDIKLEQEIKSEEDRKIEQGVEMEQNVKPEQDVKMDDGLDAIPIHTKQHPPKPRTTCCKSACDD
jgi:RNA-binding protein NOB1